jgi:hypothetical protein
VAGLKDVGDLFRFFLVFRPVSPDAPLFRGGDDCVSYAAATLIAKPNDIDVPTSWLEKAIL